MLSAALRSRRRVAVALAALALTVPAASRCASAPPPIRLDASAGAREVLLGDWAGEYVGDEVDPRRGTIAFRLQAGEDHAHGDVRMTPNESRAPTRFLSIRVVRSLDGSIAGELDPYWDPDRHCRAWTTFRGELDGRVISGTFETVYDAPIPRTRGRWRVVRR